jgi:hypothetical protein
VNPATVLTITALLGATGITALAWPRNADAPTQPAEPDTRTAAEHSGLIHTPEGDQP